MPPKPFKRHSSKPSHCNPAKTKSKSKGAKAKATKPSSKNQVVVHKYVKTVVHIHKTAGHPPTSSSPSPQAEWQNPPAALSAPVTPVNAPGRVTIYVLALSHGKFYVGKTSRPNVEDRLAEHKRGGGSAWTKRYPPLAVAHVIHNADPFDEEKVTKQWMLQHGVDNVRGGSYSRVELPPEEIASIEHQLRGITDLCFKCGQSGHFANKCTAQVDDGESSEEGEEEEEVCGRCGREGHDTSACYAKTHGRGPNWCLRCGREGHEEASCYARSHAVLTEFPEECCARCGREGHARGECYAKTHVSGARLA
jgi:predicted GIY-YIG superfamily endonuclease